MLDTNVFDVLAEDDAGREAVLEAVRHRRLQLCTTVVQEGQLAAIEDPVRRKRLQRLPRDVLPTSDHDEAVGARGGLADTIIAETAWALCDVLVTEDRALAEEARAEHGIRVWAARELVAWAAGIDG